LNLESLKLVREQRENLNGKRIGEHFQNLISAGLSDSRIVVVGKAAVGV
jgi:hypothetical protein